METTPVLATTLDLRIFSAIAEELAPSTRRAYKVQLGLLRTFYTEKGWKVFDPDGETFVVQVLEYFSAQVAAGRSLSTINKTIAALRWEAGFTNPAYVGLLSSRPVKAFLAGATRQQRSRQVRKAKALTLNDLKQVQGYLSRQRGSVFLRNRALVALGVATALRASSIVELTLGDISRAATIDGFLVRVRFSKTDQTGEGVDIPVLRAADRLLDPVRAVEQWVKHLKDIGITDLKAPLFPRIRKSVVTTEGITSADIIVTNILRDALVASGAVDAADVLGYSSHSIRATFITLSALAGVPEASIATVSGHKSMKVLRAYDRSGVERHAQVSYLGQTG